MDEEETWQALSEISLNARMRDALAFLTDARMRKEVPAALTGWGAGDAAGLALAGEEASGEELKRA